MSKVGAPAEGVDVASLFPQTVIPSRTKGIPRLLRAYSAIRPDNTGHLVTAARLARVKAHWAALSTETRAAWQSYAHSMQPWDIVWQDDFPWTGQMAHAQCNMRLLFLGSPLRAAPPDEPIYYFPAFSGLSWSYPSPNQITISWYELESASLTALISILMLPTDSGIKAHHMLVPVASIPYPDSSYTITNPAGARCWVGMMTVHMTQGHCTPLIVSPIDKGA